MKMKEHELMDMMLLLFMDSVKQVPSKKSYIRRLHRSKFFSKH